MRRVIQRQTTTIKIISVKLTWADESEPAETGSPAEPGGSGQCEEALPGAENDEAAPGDAL